MQNDPWPASMVPWIPVQKGGIDEGILGGGMLISPLC